MTSRTATRPKVYATGRLPQSVESRLSEACIFEPNKEITAVSAQTLLLNIKDASAVVCLLGDAISDAVMQQCPDLKLVANVAVGFDNIDIPAATARGILVVNTPGVLDNATADLTMGLLLSTARRIVEADNLVRAGKWGGWDLDFMIGCDTSGKTLGIIGMGRIGKAVAVRARAFGMRIIYTRNSQDANDARLETELQAQRVTLEELLDESDYISIHCPLNKETRHSIGEEHFARMKPSCILINTARGAILDQVALVKALQEKRIKGAGLDVFEDEPHVPPELLTMDNVVLTPHIGSACSDTRRAMAELAVDGLLRAFSGTMPQNTVNKEAWPLFEKRALLK